MDSLFLTILNMSLTGAFVIAVICLARLLLKRVPKVISYCLWAVAGFRFVFPFSVESALSLIPFRAAPIPPDIAMQAVPQIDIGMPVINNAISNLLPAATPTASVNPLQIWTILGAYVWISGAVIMLIYGAASYLRLKSKMKSAMPAEEGEDDIYISEKIQSPFVLGVLKPKIYIPPGLSMHERSYIVLHEQTHIERRDHIIKMAAYLVLCLHWFNPMAWVAFMLMSADMEMSCDERVLRETDNETKKEYSLSLLSLLSNRRLPSNSPPAFSEGGLKARIKNVLNFKKSSGIVIAVTIILAVMLSAGLMLNNISGTPRNPGETQPVAEREPLTFDAYLNMQSRIDLETQLSVEAQLRDIMQAEQESVTIRLSGDMETTSKALTEFEDALLQQVKEELAFMPTIDFEDALSQQVKEEFAFMPTTVEASLKVEDETADSTLYIITIVHDGDSYSLVIRWADESASTAYVTYPKRLE